MKIFIATPCAHEVVTAHYAVTLHHIAGDLADRGIANNIDILSLSEAMKRMDMESLLQTGQMATRRAYGIALRALGQVNDKVVVRPLNQIT